MRQHTGSPGRAALSWSTERRVEGRHMTRWWRRWMTPMMMRGSRGDHEGNPRLNRDLVLMGLFLHDLAKTTELSWHKGFDYTTDGNLVGHIARASIWLEECARDLEPPLPVDALAVLHNILLSHHGEPEHGALRPPMTPEAVLVSQLDNLDAKVTMSLCAVDPDGEGRAVAGGSFTERVSGTGSRLYRRDSLAD